MNPGKVFLAAALCCIVCFSGSARADFSASLTFSANNFSIDTILAADSNYYTIVNCDLSSQVDNGSVGEPQPPIISYVYSLLQGTQVNSISIASVTWQQLGTATDTVYPVQTPAITEVGAETPAFVPPGATYSQARYPTDSTIVKCTSPLQYGFGMGMATLWVWPVQYRISQGTLWLATNISFTIRTTTASRSPHLAVKRSTFMQNYITNYLKGVVENSSSVDGNLPLPVTNNYNYPTSPNNVPIEFVIVTDTAFADEMQGLRIWHDAHGMKSKVYTMQEDVIPNFTGYDDAERLRKFLMARYDSSAIFVVLAGNRHFIPIRYVSPVDANYPPGIASLIPCDLYYADVDGGNWDNDNDHIWGEPTQDSASTDIHADLWVGRVAIGRAGDATIWIDKLDRYLDNPGNGSFDYLSRAMISSADQMQWLNEAPPVAGSFSYFFDVDHTTFVELPAFNSPHPTWPLGQDVTDYLTENTPGCYISMAHGSPDYFAVSTYLVNYAVHSCVTASEQFLNLYPDDLNGYTGYVDNQGREYVHFSIACKVGAIDCEEDVIFNRDTCYAEKDLLLDGGCVAGTFNTRDGYWNFNSSKVERKKVGYICDEPLFEARMAQALYATKQFIIDSILNS